MTEAVSRKKDSQIASAERRYERVYQLYMQSTGPYARSRWWKELRDAQRELEECKNPPPKKKETRSRRNKKVFIIEVDTTLTLNDL